MASSLPLAVAVLCGIFAFISEALALTMPGWLVRKSDPSSYMEGIFYYCSGWSDCHSIIDAVLVNHMRGMFMTLWITQTIGLLLLMAGMIVIMVAACSKPYRLTMRNLFLYFNLSAGFVILIGVVSFLTVTDALQRFQQKQGISAFHKYYYSLGLALLAVFLSWIGAVAAMVYNAKDYNRRRRRTPVMMQPVYSGTKMSNGYPSNSLHALPRTSMAPDLSYQTYY